MSLSAPRLLSAISPVGLAMEYVLLAALVVGVSAGCGGVWLRRRREAPLRREI
jgi:hypothetical protein